MSEYSFAQQEAHWQAFWRKQAVYRTGSITDKKPKFYVLDMFPYPSGAGLHVGHPLGYIASDIVSRYKRMQGFNVLHPMGFDAFGLPAEQYAIQTGQHPAITTETNIKRYKEQLDKIGFSYDWDREVQTCDPAYYCWTQWIFLQLFESWYDKSSDCARPIADLIAAFDKAGNTETKAVCADETPSFSAAEWQQMDEKQRADLLMHYRLAYLAEARVNWCPALGTVLANDEVKDGLSERGGYPVEIRMMKQWMMRITAYAQRLLDGLNEIDWSEAIKEQQRNWIGRSEGASVFFELQGHNEKIEVFTTRPDTIFGVTFMVLAPEHELVSQITTPAQKAEVEAYIAKAKNRSERERMADVKSVSGAFTGAYVAHPFTGAPVPVWIADYVLAGYGTGAVMAVPGGDERDWRFARHFGLPIVEVVEGSNIAEAANPSKDARMINSDFLDGIVAREAIGKAIEALEAKGMGKGKIQFRLRDAIFSRQRYWGEPVPIYFENGVAKAVPFEDIDQITLPAVDKYLPTEDGEPPLARAENWTYQGHPLETTTMPGWAGSSWYFLRYMDPQNKDAFADRAATDYWNQVDLYMGGSEHATGHLLYARFWTHFMADRGFIGFREPFKKLVNQGMIQGVSSKIYRINIEKAAKEKLIRRLNREILNREYGDNLIIESKSEMSKQMYDIYLEQLNASIAIVQTKDVAKSYEAILDKEYSLNILVVDAQGILLSWKKMRDEIINFFNEIKTGKHVIRKTSTIETNYEVFSVNPIPKNLVQSINIPIDVVLNDGRIDVKKLKKEYSTFDKLRFTMNYGKTVVRYKEVEKMSKSKWNVVNPDDIIAQYGADTLRMYEMFLGPLEDSKPWDTKGIEGVYRFLQKFWRLFHEAGEVAISNDAPTEAELKLMHRTIKKITDDIERFSFNTSVSAFMICVNELQTLKCRKKAILEPLTRLLAPFAPHLTESCWQLLGGEGSVHLASFPTCEERYLVDDTFDYPVQENGKMRFNITLPKQGSKEELEQLAMQDEKMQQFLSTRQLKKIIVVPGRIINLVF